MEYLLSSDVIDEEKIKSLIKSSAKKKTDVIVDFDLIVCNMSFYAELLVSWFSNSPYSL